MGPYEQLRTELLAGMAARRAEAWYHEKIENAQGTQTTYVNLGRDLPKFLEWLNLMVAQERNSDNADYGSALFIIGGA